MNTECEKHPDTKSLYEEGFSFSGECPWCRMDSLRAEVERLNEGEEIASRAYADAAKEVQRLEDENAVLITRVEKANWERREAEAERDEARKAVDELWRELKDTSKKLTAARALAEEWRDLAKAREWPHADLQDLPWEAPSE